MRRPLPLRVERLEDRSTPAQFTVTTLADAGAGSLRAAIALAEADTVADTIVFDPSIQGGTVTLSTFDTGLDPTEFGPSAFNITTPVTIQGSGETIQRNTAGPAFRLFSVLTNGGNGQLTISDVELSGGLARGGNGFEGGGGAGGFGGAIYNAGLLTLRRVTISDSTARGGVGGSYSNGGVTGGGGGVGVSATGANGGGPNGGTFPASTAGGFGGGGAGDYVSTPGNGGFGGGAGATEYGTAGIGGFGGGGGVAGFSMTGGAGGFGAGAGSGTRGGGGAGMGGGVFNNGGLVTIENSTFSGNVAVGGAGAGAGQGLGGGLFNYNGTLTVASSTLADNVAAGGGRQAYALGDGAVANTTVNNSILGQGDTAVADFSGVVISGGTSNTSGSGNLIRTSVGFAGGVVTAADPLLAALAANGGPTRTRLPATGSPAIDVLAAAAAGGLTTDQRGLTRVRNGNLDIGSVEEQAGTGGGGGGAAPGTPAAPIPAPAPAPASNLPRTFVVGIGSDAQVRSATTGELVKTIQCFDPNFAGGTYVAHADVNGDGVPDIIAAAGAGGKPHVVVFDGADYHLLFSFYAFDEGFRGGVSVAAGDLNGDGFAEIVVGAGPGGDAHVRVFDVSDGTIREAKSFYAFAGEPLPEGEFDFPLTPNGGVRVAVGGGRLLVARDLASGTTAGVSGQEGVGIIQVELFRSLTDPSPQQLRALLSENGLTRSEFGVAAGDYSGDGFVDLLFGTGPATTYRTAVYVPNNPEAVLLDDQNDPVAEEYAGTAGAFPSTASRRYQAYDQSFRGGVRVGIADLNGDGFAERMYGAGPGGGPHVIILDGKTGGYFATFYADGEGYRRGVTVA